MTDANLVLGRLDPERVYGGSIRLDRERERSARSSRSGRRLGLSVAAAAQGVVDVANASMLRALRLVSVQRGYDLREFALIAYGGAGPLHAGALARQAGMSRIVVPAHSGAFSALGCLVSPLRYDAVQTLSRAPRRLGRARSSRIASRRARGTVPASAARGRPRRRVRLVPASLDLRYTGQNYEITVRYEGSDVAALRGPSSERHRQLYGYATGERSSASTCA